MLSIFGSWFFCSPPLPSQEHCTPLGWCSSEVPLNTQHSSILNAVLCVLTKLWLFHSSSEKKLMNSGFTEQVSTVSAPVVTRTSDVGASLEDRRNSQCGNDLQPAYLLSLWLFQNSWKFPGWVVRNRHSCFPRGFIPLLGETFSFLLIPGVCTPCFLVPLLSKCSDSREAFRRCFVTVGVVLQNKSCTRLEAQNPTTVKFGRDLSDQVHLLA